MYEIYDGQFLFSGTFDATHDFLFGKVRTWSFAVYALILIPRITDNGFCFSFS